VIDKQARKWLIAIFVVTLATRLTLAFLIPNFTYDSYFHLRQVEHITNTGLPLYEDPLSYGGRELVFLPFFHYFIALFDLFLPLELVAKIIPNLLIAGLTIIVYLLGKKITADTPAALFSALVAGFLPILFFTNALTVESLFFPLVFLAIYLFMNLPEKKYVYGYITVFLLLSLTSSATFLLLVGFGIYLLLSLVEGKKINRAELELILFSTFFYLWIQLIFFKSVLLQEGIGFIWQNIPSAIIAEYFPAISITQALVLVSIIPFVAGIWVVYRSLFQLKNTRAFLLISLVISTTILTWLRLIQFEASLGFVSIILAILFASFYQEALIFLAKTKIAHLHRRFSLALIILLLPTLVYPALAAAWQQEVPSEEEVIAFKTLQVNTPPDARVLALLKEGHLVTYYGQRKNLMDGQFALIPDIEERFADSQLLYTTSFQTQAIGIMDKYNLRYLMITSQARKRFDITIFKYFDTDCFQRIYKNETRVYKTTCTLTTLE